VIDLGAEYQMALELRPAHDPTRPFGFVGVVVSLKDLSSSIWAWRLEGSNGSAWRVQKVIDIPAEPADPDQLPPVLKPFKAVPALLTDINLSLDDRYLYASCWGTGELKQFDVSDPLHPVETGSVKLGGIVRRAKHPTSGPLLGGPQMVEVSRDGRRVYVTNSLYRSWDDQFYPEGMRGWLARIEARPEGGITLDPKFFVESDQRLHQVHLEGGDASSDSYCFA
jgi:selenium-binding protein 1